MRLGVKHIFGRTISNPKSVFVGPGIKSALVEFGPGHGHAISITISINFFAAFRFIRFAF